MTTRDSAGDPPHLCSDRGRWYVPVPWGRADHLHAALRRAGHPSVLCLDPETRAARLELWPGVSPAEALAELGRLTAASGHAGGTVPAPPVSVRREPVLAVPGSPGQRV
jgi:hypothetical protein